MATAATKILYNNFPSLLSTAAVWLQIHSLFTFTKQYFPFAERLKIQNEKKNAEDTLKLWFTKVIRYRRFKRSNAILIQKIYRGYQSRKHVEKEILKTLSFYSKEVDSLELLLRRGVHASVYDPSSSRWIECVLLLNGSCDQVNLSLQYKNHSTKKDEHITYLLRDIAEIYRSTAVRLLSFEDETNMSWSAIPTSPHKKSRITKGKYGFFTIIGSSVTRPSVQIAVESKITCAALVDSLRAVSSIKPSRESHSHSHHLVS
jgi:hypothetical protein